MAPLLCAAGWKVVLAARNREVLGTINEDGGLLLRTVGDRIGGRWIGGVSAIPLDDPDLPRVVAEADLLATSVGPSSLTDVGRMLAPMLNARLGASDNPVNLITFENHRRATELLTLGLLEACPSLAGQIGSRLGVGGSAVWRVISCREVTDSVVRFDADDVDECYVDVASLVPGVAPLDGSVPGLELVRSFDDRMVEKLWTFNAGHAAAAYLGWHAGCATLDEAMSKTEIRAAVREIVAEAQRAFEAYLAARFGSAPIPPRSLDWILDRYADPALSDSVARVGRDPRRKLAPGDRLIGPAIACRAAGLEPTALAAAVAAALTYDECSDPQAPGLQRELELLGPEEVLSTVSTLDPQDELARLICDGYRERTTQEVAD